MWEDFKLWSYDSISWFVPLLFSWEPILKLMHWSLVCLIRYCIQTPVMECQCLAVYQTFLLNIFLFLLTVKKAVPENFLKESFLFDSFCFAAFSGSRWIFVPHVDITKCRFGFLFLVLYFFNSSLLTLWQSPPPSS